MELPDTGFVVEVKHIETAIELLLSCDNDVVLAAIGNLDCFIVREGIAGLTLLDQHEISLNLVQVLHRTQSIARLALKIIVQLQDVNGFYDRHEAKAYFIRPIIDAYVLINDDVVSECATYILGRFGESDTCAFELCRTDVILKLFHQIESSVDQDIIVNCLRVLCNYLHGRYAIRFLGNCMYVFQIEILLDLLKCPRSFDTDSITLDILNTVSQWNCSQMNILLYKSRTINFFFTCVQKPVWTNIHNTFLSMLCSCANNMPNQVQNVATQDLINFIKFAMAASPEHILACVTLMAEFAKSSNARQVLYGFGLEKLFLELYKKECKLTQVKICDALSELCSHQTIAQQLLNSTLFEYFASLFNNDDYPWSPYRQAPISPLFVCLLDNPKLSFVYYKNGILWYIKECLTKYDEIDNSKYEMTIDMFHSLISNKAFQRYLLTEQIYMTIVLLLKNEKNEFVRRALDILKDTIESADCRSWFVKSKCSLYILEKLSLADTSAEPDPYFIDDLMVFIELACKYKSVAVEFCQLGFVTILEELSHNSLRMKTLCKSTIDAIYGHNLSFKFYNKNYLSINDKIDNGFHTFIGLKPTSFPFEELCFADEYYTTPTVVIVDLVQTDLVHQSSSGNLFKRNLICIHEPSTLTTDTQSVTTLTDRISMLTSRDAASTSTSINTNTNTSTTEYNNRMQKFRSVIVPLIENEDCIANRIKHLANFVHHELCGHSTYSVPNIFEYNSHLIEVKMECNSNFIPLSKLRIGSIVERTVLFKLLADEIDIPCTLLRNQKTNWMWNEIPVLHFDQYSLDRDSHQMIGMHIVDLAFNVGELLPSEKYPGLRYCYGNNIPSKLLLHCVQNAFDQSSLM